MTDRISQLSRIIRMKMRGSYPSLPRGEIIREILGIAYLATLKTEEGRPVRGSLTLANPRRPHPDPPPLRRADFPSFTPFRNRIPLSVESLAKLSLAIDRWSGSIAIFITPRNSVYAWGVADQLIHHNVLMNWESRHGFSFPGLLTVNMEGPGDLSIYSGSLFIACLQQDQVISFEPNSLWSQLVVRKLLPSFKPVGSVVAKLIELKLDRARCLRQLHAAWVKTVSRMCIGLKRQGAGGAFLITPEPKENSSTSSINFPTDASEIVLSWVS